MRLFNFFLMAMFVSIKGIAAVTPDNPMLTWNGNMYRHIMDYKKKHQVFSDKYCKPGTEEKYMELLKAYRGSGHYIPEVKNIIDREAIQNNIHQYRKKIKFISALIARLKKEKKIPKYKEISGPLEEILSQLVTIKKLYVLETDESKKKVLLNDSKILLEKMSILYDKFIDSIFFLKAYNYPNDHLKNRQDFDARKDSPYLQDIKKANEIFFYRKLVEDGAYDPNHTRPDIFIRTAIDTIYLNIRKEKDIISENLRYDIQWLLDRVAGVLERDYQIQLDRLGEWKTRTQESSNFYSEIIKYKNREKANELVKVKNNTSLALKEFVYRKQADAYHYWSQASELHKAIFAIETILYNEVGSVDGEDGLERKDVAKVVLNRQRDHFYRSLHSEQEIYKYILEVMKKNEIENEYWLNVLFRVGEFSFTYHYIDGAVKIFCPDMSRRGKNLRRENMKIAMQALKNRDEEFKGLRYFSRTSMIGKIDIGGVWNDYLKIPERAGLEVFGQNRLALNYKENKYNYHYSFIDPKKVEYHVVEMDKNIYSVRLSKGRPVFYKYRSPQLFTYFEKK